MLVVVRRWACPRSVGPDITRSLQPVMEQIDGGMGHAPLVAHVGLYTAVQWPRAQAHIQIPDATRHSPLLCQHVVPAGPSTSPCTRSATVRVPEAAPTRASLHRVRVLGASSTRGPRRPRQQRLAQGATIESAKSGGEKHGPARGDP
jgi:hypothetical protein